MLRIGHGALVELLETAYGDHGDAWAERVLAQVLAMANARSGGFLRYRTEYVGGSFKIHTLAQLEAGPDHAGWDDSVVRLVEREPQAEILFGKTTGGFLSQEMGLGPALATTPPFRALWRPPIVDVMGLLSHDASGAGLQFAAALDEVHDLTSAEARMLTRLATHLGAGDRLRAVTERLDAADAVFSARGKLLHASDDAQARHDAVRDGVDRRASAHKERDADKALEVWQGLVDGTWSIVDHFDTDGKRFVIALHNAPEVDPRAGLSPSDRRVAALAAMGDRDKDIAYTLGLTPGAVAAALRRVRAALGVRTRTELAARWRRSR